MFYKAEAVSLKQQQTAKVFLPICQWGEVHLLAAHIHTDSDLSQGSFKVGNGLSQVILLQKKKEIYLKFKLIL